MSNFLTFTLETGVRCLLGFPLIVAATLDNRTNTHWYGLREFGVLSLAAPLGFTFARSDGRVIVLPPAITAPEPRQRGGLTLAPGEAATMLFDVSVHDASLEPGLYQVTAVYRHGPRLVEAPPVTLELVEPRPRDHEVAERLRSQVDDGDPSWSNFISDNFRTVDATGLSVAARDHLAYHLFVHHAVYGPTAIADLDVTPLRRQVTGPLTAEVELLALEIAGEADPPGLSRSAQRAAPLLARWPGLRGRVAEIERRDGVLTAWRTEFGADRTYPPRRPPLDTATR